MAYYHGHSNDYRDYPLYAQPCLADAADGYPWTTCDRSNGSCCPGAQHPGMKHFVVWSCALEGCSSNEGHAQYAADIFQRECATHGYPLPLSAYEGDLFPAAYGCTDFVTAQHPPLSGFYGWGVLSAWTFALTAASFSGIRLSRRRLAGSSARIARRWIGYMGQDTELFAALAVAWIAAGDILVRSSRVSDHQVFSYADPSFVAVSDGDDKGSDILTIRAAFVVVNHFTISAWPLALLPLVALGWKEKLRGCLPRQLLRTLAILVTLIWCNAATKSLMCASDPSPRPSSCGLTYYTLGSLANVAGMVPGVTCRLNKHDVLIPLSFLMAVIVCLGTVQLGRQLQGPISVRYFATILLAFLFLAIAIPTMYSLAVVIYWYLTTLFIGTVMVPFWYISSEGRQCTFWSSSVIGFSELDQIVTVATGAVLSAASIRDSLSDFTGEE